ncbi:MAG TPA: WYL domain-containing protein [Candidatus Anoxymicrobiaceae bacterium]
MAGKVPERLNRILLMVPFIVANDGATVDELCEKFNIDRDELVCDLDTLRMCGVPDYTPADLIDYKIEGDRVFMTMADYFKRPLTMTREEGLTLLVAGHALIRSGVFEADGPLGTALDKIERLLSVKEQIELESVAERIDVEMNAFTGSWMAIIEEGLGKQQRLVIDYYSYSSGEIAKRRVDPLSLLWSRGCWYLLAFCHEAHDTRLFRLDRIRNLKLTGEPVADDAHKFELPEIIGEYKPGRKAHKVKLRFSGREGRRLVEEWPTARLADAPDGTVEVVLRTRNLVWLSNYLLRFGDRVRIESPAELRKIVEEKARALLKEYGSG